MTVVDSGTPAASPRVTDTHPFAAEGNLLDPPAPPPPEK